MPTNPDQSADPQTLKLYFETGDSPTQSQFGELIDSIPVSTSVAGLQDLIVPDRTIVMLTGSESKHDGAGYWPVIYLEDSTATVNNGTVHNGPGGVGRYQTLTPPRNIRQWGGAVFPTDCTSALQAAITYWGSVGGWQEIYLDGDFTFDPQSLTYPSISGHGVELSINGKIRPTDTIDITHHFTISGRGGGSYSAVPFYMSPAADVQGVSGSVPTLRVTDGSGKTLKNLLINGAYIGIYCLGYPNIGARLYVDNVSVLCTADDSVSLVVDAYFWSVWRNCNFATTPNGYKSISFQSNHAIYTGGLADFYNCTTAGKGIEFVGGANGTGNVKFHTHDHESLPAGEDFCSTKVGPLGQTAVQGIFFDRLAVHDSLSGAGDTFNFTAARPKRFEIYNSLQTPSFTDDVFPDYGSVEDGSVFDYTAGRKQMAGSSPTLFGKLRGLLKARRLDRGHKPLAIGATTEAITIEVPATFTNMTVTAAEYIDGTTSRTKKYVPATTTGATNTWQSSLVLTGSYSEGDVIACTTMIKYLDKTNAVYNEGSVVNMGLYHGTPPVITQVSGTGRTVTEVSACGKEAEVNSDGWIPLLLVMRVVSATSTPSVYIIVSIKDSSPGIMLSPFNINVYRAANATTLDDVLRLGEAGQLTDAKPGVVSCEKHQGIRLGRFTTAERNAIGAAAFGEGVMIYDTTLGYLITSNGSVFKNGVGTTV